MGKKKSELLNQVATYYSEKLSEYGVVPLGVDWNGEESQMIRFSQLCKIIESDICEFTLNDLGCGYGALLDYLKENFKNYSYLGVDICDQMIKVARQKNPENNRIRFISSSEPDQIAKYSIASGIFNVRLKLSDEEWFDYLQTTLDVLNRNSSLGFAFNCLTSYSDETKKRDYLYYADPCHLFDLCKQRYSNQVALFHDYGLYEFTIIVRKF